MKKDFAAVSICVSVGTMLLIMSLYGSMPKHLETVSISDPVDNDLEPYCDIVALSGSLEGDEFVATVEVRGTVADSSSGYTVNIVARFADRSDATPHIYKMEYYDGWVRTNGVLAYTWEGDLVFFFPLRLLADDAYIVGIEALAGGPSGTDFANAGSRDDMQLLYELDTGVSPLVTFVAGAAALAVGAVVFAVRFDVMRCK